MPSKTILFTRPNHDFQTSYLHFFAGNLIKEIKQIGEHKLIDLDGKKAIRKTFEQSISKKEPRLIILNGHGVYNAIFGYNEIILDSENIDLLNSKIVYAVACDSAEQLGELAVSKGNADAYIGYNARFMIVIDPSRTTTPSKDKNVLPFLKSYSSLILSLLAGLTVEQSIENSKTEMRRSIRRYGVSGIRDEYGDAPLIRYALFWNLCFLKGNGNLSSVI